MLNVQLFMRIRQDSWQISIIIYKFLEEKDKQEMVNHISSGLSEMKTLRHSAALLCSPAVCINHSLIFPACLQGLSVEAPESSLQSSSDLLFLSCGCSLHL